MDLFLKKLNMVVLKKLRIFAYMSVHLILRDGHCKAETQDVYYAADQRVAVIWGDIGSPAKFRV